MRYGLTCVLLTIAHGLLIADDSFFESAIRPVLVEKCYSCHSATAKSVKGGLKLDRSDAILAGGDSGPVLSPGQAKNSLLLKVIRHDEGVSAMPPKGDKLTAKQIADFESWINAGAKLPKDRVVASVKDGKDHWAFRPLAEFKSSDSIDSLLETQRQLTGTTASPSADRRTLLRRVSLDLTGLPPTWDELNQFEKDPSPEAYRLAIERMLKSERYGERWARHWLDVARYADTKDNVLQFGNDRIRPFAYTYRDYVIKAFNDDLPINEFITDQIAANLKGSQLPPWRLAALGFLTLGRTFDNNLYDIIDDRIDTVSRGFLGLTVSCARCHDHKFDPISIRDYYSMYGIFSAGSVPHDLPPLDPQRKGPADYEKKYAEATSKLTSFLDSQYALLLDQFRRQSGEYLERIATTKPDPIEQAIFFFSFAPDELRPNLVHRWRKYLNQHAQPGHPIFGPWAELMALPTDNFSKSAKAIINKTTAHPALMKHLKPLAESKWPVTRADVANAYGRMISDHHARYHGHPSPQVTATDRPIETLFQKPDGPAFFPFEQVSRYLSRKEADSLGSQLTNIDKLSVAEANAPPRAMVLHDSPDATDARLFIRGQPTQPGDIVPRQFISTLAPAKVDPYRVGSGRLELANDIARHPLTARVFVNRVWMHHFGEPLVDTPNDFGVRTVKPLQSALLDFLAQKLIKSGWSLKALHRDIVLSRAYQQSSNDRAEMRKVDPENRTIWKANRRRLDFESMRDGMLFAAGRLQFQVGGRPKDAINDPLDQRRSVYLLIDRQSLPGVLRSFDFAVPDQSVDRRPQTTVPQQALFGLNSPFVLAQSQAACARPEIAGALEPTTKIRGLYRAILHREPDDDELKSAKLFIGENRFAEFAQVLLLSNEFLFVD